MKFKVHYSDVLQEDITKFFQEKGLRGSWIHPTIYELDASYTMQEWDMAHHLCQTGFRVNGVPITTRVLIPPPPQLMYTTNVI